MDDPGQEEKSICSRASSGQHSCAFSVRQNMEYSDQRKYKKQYSGNTEISGKRRNRPWDVQKEGKLYTAFCLCAKRFSGYYLGICQDHRL